MSFTRLSPRATRFGLAVGASLALFAASLPGAASAKPNAAQSGHVDPIVKKKFAADARGDVQVIITRDHSGSDDADVRRHGGRVLQKLNLANTTVAVVPVKQVDGLASEPGVVRISYDTPVSVQTLDPLSLASAQLQTVFPAAVDASTQWNGARQLRGTGVGVAIIDSGVRSSHPDFQGGSLLGSGRLLNVLNGISGSPLSGVDDNGHGTFVAGIIGGRGWGVPGVTAGSYVGTAPDANLISIKVANSTGMAHVSDVIGAIEWVSKNRKAYNIRVLNLSLVTSVADSYHTDLLDAAVELAWLQGLVVVVAAGNAGPNAGITAPANDPFVITVGATDDKGTLSTADDTLAAFSSYGTTVDHLIKPDLVAPGRHIVSTLSSRTDPLALRFPTRVTGGGSYISLSGTSAAAPVISGVIAQLLQGRPMLSPGQVKWLLTQTAQPVAGSGTGAGYPRVGAAVGYTNALHNANVGLRPNEYLRAAFVGNTGQTWGTVSWDSVSWDSVSWDSVSWDSVSWDSVSWDSVSWLPAD